MLPYEPEPDLELSGTSVLVATGGRDPLVPPAQSRDLEQRLGRAGATVAFSMDETGGHGLVENDMIALASWLEELL